MDVTDNQRECLTIDINKKTKEASTPLCQYHETNADPTLPVNAHKYNTALSLFQTVPYDYIQGCLWSMLSTCKNSMDGMQPIRFSQMPSNTIVEQHTSENLRNKEDDEVVTPLSSDEATGVEELAVSSLLQRSSRWLASVRMAAELRYSDLVAGIYNKQTQSIAQHLKTDSQENHSSENLQSENVMPLKPGIERKYQCSECSYQCDSRWHMTRHVSTVHSGTKPFFCYICNVEFSRSEKVKTHFLRKHPNIKYDIANARRSSDFSDHKVNITSWKVASTPVNNSSSDSMPLQDLLSSSTSDDQNHHLSMNGVTQTLHNLKKESSEIDAVYDMTDYCSISNQKPVCCPLCTYRCKDSWHLRRHVSNVHSEEKEFNCPSCDYATNRRHRLVSHMKNHGKLFCSFCNFSTSDTHQYEDHYKHCSRQTKKADFACDDCNTTFANRRLFREHMNASHNVNLFCCDLCLFWTPSAEQYQVHRETHRRSSLSLNDKSPLKHCHLLGQPAIPASLLPPQNTLPIIVQPLDNNNYNSAMETQTSHTNPITMHTDNSIAADGAIDPTCVSFRHGRGAFQCPYCPDRQPFIYKKSFDKHMSNHNIPSVY